MLVWLINVRYRAPLSFVILPGQRFVSSSYVRAEDSHPSATGGTPAQWRYCSTPASGWPRPGDPGCWPVRLESGQSQGYRNSACRVSPTRRRKLNISTKRAGQPRPFAAAGERGLRSRRWVLAHQLSVGGHTLLYASRRHPAGCMATHAVWTCPEPMRRSGQPRLALGWHLAGAEPAASSVQQDLAETLGTLPGRRVGGRLFARPAYGN